MPGKSKSSKATTLTVAIVFTISVSGYFMGLRQTVRETGHSEHAVEIYADDESAEGKIQQAVDYDQIANAGFGPNTNFKSHLKTLRIIPAKKGAQDSLLTASDKLRAKREARRAYDGAPPIVPHPIAQDNAASCLQCHAEATLIGNVVAPAISHPNYTSCTQCHVSEKGLGSIWITPEFDLHTGNQFQGEHQPKPVEKAYANSPATIPHTLHMRQNCMSCHGELGTNPIRTSHPERQSCTQCHVPGSLVDKSNFGESPFPFREGIANSGSNAN